MNTATEVLDHDQIVSRIRRIAWQIYERHASLDEVVIAGIDRRGFLLAQKISEVLRNISPLEVHLLKLLLDKKDPLNSKPRLEPDSVDPVGKSIVVIDDVLNTGSTLIYGVRYFLNFRVAGIGTAVLVDRNHKNYPVKADYKGLSLSTSTKEHVDVNIESTPYSVTVS